MKQTGSCGFEYPQERRVDRIQRWREGSALAKLRDGKNAEKQRGAGGGTAQDIQEEIAFVRQKCNSLSFRGHYAECVKMIEDSFDLLYFKERWPENFLSILRLHQKCYPSLHKGQTHEEYLAALLKKNDIPFAFARLLYMPEGSVVWKAEFFRDLVLDCSDAKDYEGAIAYSDILLKLDPVSVSARVVKANVLEEMGRGNDAVREYERALELGPGNRHALSGMARHYRDSDPKKALQYIEKALESNPDDARLHLVRAEILVATGDREAAIAALDDAHDADPYNAEVPYQKGEIYYSENSRAKAITQYRLAIALNEKHVPTLMRLVELSYDDRPELALIYVNTIHTLRPENRDAILLRARLLRRTGELDAAAAQYLELLEREPENHEAKGAIGAIYLVRQDAGQALPYLMEAVRLAPEEAGYHFDKARAHLALSEEDAAAAELRETVRLDKHNARAWSELGHLCAKTGPDEAVGYFTRAIAIAPDNPYYYTARGELLATMPGRREEALASFDLASKYDPGNGVLHARVGRLLAEAGNAASAIGHLKQAVLINPDDDESYYLLARLLADTRPDEALMYVNSAISLSVTRGEYYYLKSRILIELGQDAQAVEQLGQSLKLEKNPEAYGEYAQLTSGNSPRIALMYINRALELAPDNPAFLCMRAHLLFSLGQKDKARLQYEKLLEVSPNLHEALFGLARVYADRKERKTALDFFNKAIAAAPAEAECHAEKAAFLAQEEDGYAEAVEEYTQALALNNQMWKVVMEKARLLDDHGEIAAAMQEYRRVLLLRPDTVEASARMGELLTDYSCAQAMIYLDHAIKLEPRDYRYHVLRARALLGLARDDEAADELQGALLLGGDVADTNFFIAETLAAARPELALRYCRNAVLRDDNKAEYHQLCGNLYMALSDPVSARDSFQKSAALDSKNHEALSRLAHVAYLLEEENAGELVEAALAVKPDYAPCLYIKARIYADREDNIASAIEFIKYAIELEPRNLEFQELLSEYYTRSRSYIKLALQKRKVEKLRRKLAESIELPEPPEFEREEPPQPADANGNSPPDGQDQAAEENPQNSEGAVPLETPQSGPREEEHPAEGEPTES